MKKNSIILIAVLWLTVSSVSLAMQGHDTHADHSGKSSHKPTAGHGDTQHTNTGGTFTHESVVENIRAEFQVMSLESMNMKDPEGHTHHIMVKLFPEGSYEQIKNAVGKIKIISPSKKETVATLKDYSGIFAANFTVDEPGKYGIICLLKVNDKKPLYKFWYHHME